MYRTYSYNNMPEPVRRQSGEEHKSPPKKNDEVCEKPCREEKNDAESLLGMLKSDDIIIIAVVLLLLLDDCDDKLLLIALAFIFFSEWL